jgi:ABC-type Fe3+/spermidine/putrescine transport system ATPase subunit
MVFQKYALFPHLTVFENVAFGLQLKKVNAKEIKERVDESLALVNLQGFAGRMPETLSGGQQQRVALARALVNRPSIVLLDEPLGALDQKLREKMQADLRLLQKRLGLTFIFVTHDQEEAMILSDRIAVMNAGRLEQVATPRELFEQPSSLFSARFIGGRNELNGRATASGFEMGGQRLEGISVCRELSQRGAGASVCAFVRPEMLRVTEIGVGANSLKGRVVQILFRGSKSEVVVETSEGLSLRSMMDPSDASNLKVGSPIALHFAPTDTHLFWAGE